MLRLDRPEVALAGPEHDGYDVHAHLVDQARGKHLATDVASGDLDYAVTRELLRLGHGCLDAVDEVKRRLGVPAVGRRPVRYDDHVVDPARRLPVPAVRHVEDVAADDCRPDLVPAYGRVYVVGRRGDTFTSPSRRTRHTRMDNQSNTSAVVAEPVHELVATARGLSSLAGTGPQIGHSVS